MLFKDSYDYAYSLKKLSPEGPNAINKPIKTGFLPDYQPEKNSKIFTPWFQKNMKHKRTTPCTHCHRFYFLVGTNFLCLMYQGMYKKSKCKFPTSRSWLSNCFYQETDLVMVTRVHCEHCRKCPITFES